MTNTLGQLDRDLEHQGTERLFFAPAYGGEADEDRVIRFRGIHPVIYPDCSLAYPARRVRQE